MEAFLEKQIPDLQRLYQDQFPKSQKNSKSFTVFPKLFQFQLNSQSKNISIEDIKQMVYEQCSQLVLLQRDSCISLFDLHSKKMLYSFQWGFNISKILLKRNLNSYKAKLISKKFFKSLHAFPRKIDILFDDNYLVSESIILENELKDLLFSVVSIKKNFQKMQERIWIDSEFKNESFVFATQNKNSGELFFFKVELFNKESDRHNCGNISK